MEELTREILTQIQGGKVAFRPEDTSHDSLVEFQARVKRIEWAKARGYIKRISSKPCTYDSTPGLILGVRILGGLTLEGEQLLLDENLAAF